MRFICAQKNCNCFQKMYGFFYSFPLTYPPIIFKNPISSLNYPQNLWISRLITIITICNIKKKCNYKKRFTFEPILYIIRRDMF